MKSFVLFKILLIWPTETLSMATCPSSCAEKAKGEVEQEDEDIVAVSTFQLVLKESNRGRRISIISFSFFRASFIFSRLSRIFVCEADVRVHDVIKGRCRRRENSPVPMIHMILSEIDYFLHLV